MHCSQRADLRLPALHRLGPDCAADGRFELEFAGDAEALRAPGKLPSPSRSSLVLEDGINLTRHGWNGWLHTEKAIPTAALHNRTLKDAIGSAALAAFLQDGRQADRIRWAFEGAFDPNDWRLVRENAWGYGTYR